jgi:hypothetical protein
LRSGGKREPNSSGNRLAMIGEGEIDITFSYLPSSEELCKNQQGLRLG